MKEHNFLVILCVFVSIVLALALLGSCSVGYLIARAAHGQEDVRR